MAYPAILTFDYPLFVLQFPAYANATTYPEALMQSYWDIGTNYVSDFAWCGSLTGSNRQYALNLMVAHLTYLAGLAATGQVPGLMQSATIDKVSVALTPPPLKNQFWWWLSLSPYGQQLLALLQVNSVGGEYIGGSGVLQSFGYQGGLYPYGSPYGYPRYR